MTLSSSVAMYSVMRDIPDARKIPMERGWVVLYLYATCKFSNLLPLEQWAFEYGLPFFFIRTVYWFNSHSFFLILKEIKSVDSLISFGNELQISGPWCRRIYALKVFLDCLSGFCYVHVLGINVGFLSYEQKLVNTGGNNSFLYLNMNIALCRVFMSCNLKTFNR